MSLSLRHLVLLAMGIAAQGHAQNSESSPNSLPGVQSLAVSRFEFAYGLSHPDLPPLEALSELRVPLVLKEGVWTSEEKIVGEPVALGALPAESRFDAAALRAIAARVVAHYNAAGIFGVWVAFDGIEASASVSGANTLADNRLAGNSGARIVVWASQVKEVRTLARGERFPSDKANNNPKHAWIVAASPLQPAPSADAPGSLMKRDSLETYLGDLSRLPGRRVEVSVASAGQPGEVVLDYLVNETKPWQLFAQVSNTGTEATGEWRERLGYQQNQLTNRDDTLNVDFVTTADFETLTGFFSYRFPLFRPSRLSARIFGSYGDFTANSQTFQDLRFAGDNWSGGGEFAYIQSLFKSWDFSVTVGARYSHFGVDSGIGAVSLSSAESDFLIPYLGLSLSRDAGAWAAQTGVLVEHSVSGVPNSDPTKGLQGLGRLGADETWTSLRWNADYTVYLDNLLSSAGGNRAHELSFRARGRYLPGGEILVPQEQDVLGGAYSVRGYDESVLAADESLVFTAEYAWHIARGLRPGEPGRLFGQSFRWRPPAQRRAADWDLIFRGFTDYGFRWVNTDSSSSGASTSAISNRDLSLFGAGGGLELVILQNFSLRCDVGMVLEDIKDTNETLAESGDVRAHIAASIIW